MSSSPPTDLAVALRDRVRIDNRRRWFPDLRELYRYRYLIAILGRRDITVRFRQTVLGSIWLFAGALITAGLFSFVFGSIADLPSGGVPYFVFSFAGLLAWNVFSNTLSSATGSLSPNSSLISKIYFPRLVLPLATLVPMLVNTLLSFGVMIVLLVIYAIAVTVQMLLLPVWLALGIVLGMGVGLVLGAFSVEYRDVGYATPIFTSFLLYLSPVAYSIEAVPAHLRNLYFLNPIATVVSGARWSLLGGSELPPTWAIAYTIVFALGALILGTAVFIRREDGFADVI